MTNSTASLKLITNDRFKKTLKTTCSVKMFDSVDNFDEFVTVGLNADTNQTTIMHNADPVLLGQAWIMMGHIFKNALHSLPQETQDQIVQYLAEG